MITDGEEAGLLGADAFLQNAALKARVGAVVNVEARGTRGRSLSVPDQPRRRPADRSLRRRACRCYATSSLYAEIYRLLPNDTDLTLFINARLSVVQLRLRGKRRALPHAARPRATISIRATLADAWRQYAGRGERRWSRRISPR